jgi:hypothetical protein
MKLSVKTTPVHRKMLRRALQGLSLFSVLAVFGMARQAFAGVCDPPNTCPDCVCYDLFVTKTCTEAKISPDGTKVIVNFSGTVKNPSGLPLFNVTITDDPSAQFSQLPPDILSAGEMAPFAGSYETTTILEGGFRDTVTVTGTGPSGGGYSTVSRSDTAICPPVTPEPKITVTKKCTNPTTPFGQPVKFNGQVCNKGDEQLTNVTVTDTPLAKSITLDKKVLAPNECTNYQGEYETTQTLKDTVTAEGIGKLSGEKAMATASATCTVVQPKLSVELNGDCPLINNTQTVEFSGQACNNGNENLKNVKVIINKPQANTQLVFPTTLAKGECKPFKHTYLPPPAKDSATVTVTAVGVSSGLPVSGKATASYECPVIPPDVAITVTTACKNPATRLGSPIPYTGEICNVEDAVNRLSLVVDRPKANTPIKLSKTNLGTGQCLTYQGSYRSSTSGRLAHTVKVTAFSLDNTVDAEATASATCAVGQSCSPADWIGLGAVNGWYTYTPTQKVGAVFSGAKTAGFTALANLTLLQALSNKTFSTTLETAAGRLIKQAIAALLNATHPNVHYPIEDTQTIINQVNAALTSKNLATIQALTQTLNVYNLLGGAAAVCQADPPC